MKYFFAICLFTFAVLGFYFTLQYVWVKEKEYVENRLLALLCFASGLWSFGFGVQIMQTNADAAYMCRVIGMIGTFMYLIIAQVLVCYVSEIPKVWRNIFNGISYAGVIIYFFTIQKDQIVYKLSPTRGMTYSFKPGIGNTIYTVYCVIVALDLLCVMLYMVYADKGERIRVFGKKMLFVELFIFFGMILDTVVPLFGIPAIPGSTLMQFFGMVVVRAAVHESNRSRINIENLSEFMYYSLSVPVLIFDMNRRIQMVNDAATSFFGIEKREMTNKNICISEMFEVEDDEAFEFYGMRKDVDAVCRKNRAHCSLAINKIHDHYGDAIGYIIIVTDLSERVKTMQRLEEAIKTADAANQAKSTFLANMSHEIRTPMNVILGFSELVLKMDISQQVREYVQDIKDSSENLLAIINDLLDISKIESGKMELVCSEYYTSSLFKDVFLIINAQAKRKGLMFKMTIAPDMPSRFYGDKIRIRGVLINLLNNAVKYTKEGSVTFEATVLEAEGENVRLQFKVADTGVGIRKEEQDRLFESFSQVDRKVHYGVEGTGLGLAIVKGYVTLMNGDVTVESEYGVGSVFIATIEQKIIDARPMDAFLTQESESTEDFRLGNIKIFGTRVLVVDDNQINLKVAGSTLGYYGLDVDVAASGREAIDLCKMHEYQMVFMDQMMPQMDGIEAMKEIRKISPYYAVGGAAKIIVLTANAVAGVRQQLLEEGFDEYLGKPMNFKQLERLFVRFLPEKKIRSCAAEQQEESEEKKELRELGEMIPQADVSQGITFCGGRLTDYLAVLRVTYRNGEKTLKELDELQKKADYENYTIKIHGLKSTSLSIGAKSVSDMAKEQELAGKSGDYAFIDMHIEDFAREYRRLLSQIQTVLEHYQMLDEKQRTRQEKVVTETDIKHFFENIIRYMDEFDFAGAAKLVRQEKENAVPEAYREDIEKLSRWMDEMDEEKIRGLIAQRMPE